MNLNKQITTEQQYNLYKETQFMTAQKITTESVKSKEVLQVLKNLESGKKTIEEVRQYYEDKLLGITVRRAERRDWVDGQKQFNLDIKKDNINKDWTPEGAEEYEDLTSFQKGYYDAFIEYERRNR